MRDYFIRRFLLILPTLIGATMVVFFITRITPGGPLEAALQKAAALQAERGMKDAGASLSEEQKGEMADYFGFEGEFKWEMPRREKLKWGWQQFISYLARP